MGGSGSSTVEATAAIHPSRVTLSPRLRPARASTVSSALRLKFYAALRQVGDDLVPQVLVHVPVPFLRRDLNKAADLEAMDRSRSHAGGLSKVVDGQLH